MIITIALVVRYGLIIKKKEHDIHLFYFVCLSYLGSFSVSGYCETGKFACQER